LGTMGNSYSTEQSTNRGLNGPRRLPVRTLGGPPSPLEGFHLTGVSTRHPVHPWRPHFDFTAALTRATDDGVFAMDEAEADVRGRPRGCFTTDLAVLI